MIDPEENNPMTDTAKFRAMYAKAIPKTPTRTDDTSKYLLSILAALVLGVIGTTLILWVRPEYDPIIVSVAVFGFLTPTVTSMLALMKTSEVNEQAKETHLAVNSRLDVMLDNASLAARAKGRAEGAAIANERTDDLAKKAKE